MVDDTGAAGPEPGATIEERMAAWEKRLDSAAVEARAAFQVTVDEIEALQEPGGGGPPSAPD